MTHLLNICRLALDGIDNGQRIYTEERLLEALNHIVRPNMKDEEIRDSIIQSSFRSLHQIWSQDGKMQRQDLYVFKLYDKIRKNREITNDENIYGDLYGFINQLTEKGLYGKYILENYTREEILELENEIKQKEISYLRIVE